MVREYGVVKEIRHIDFYFKTCTITHYIASAKGISGFGTTWLDNMGFYTYVSGGCNGFDTACGSVCLSVCLCVFQTLRDEWNGINSHR